MTEKKDAASRQKRARVNHGPLGEYRLFMGYAHHMAGTLQRIFKAELKRIERIYEVTVEKSLAKHHGMQWFKGKDTFDEGRRKRLLANCEGIDFKCFAPPPPLGTIERETLEGFRNVVNALLLVQSFLEHANRPLGECRMCDKKAYKPNGKWCEPAPRDSPGDKTECQRAYNNMRNDFFSVTKNPKMARAYKAIDNY